MRKLTLCLAAFASAICATSSTAASSNGPWQFYGGVDYQYVSPSYESPYDTILPSKLGSGADVHIGAQYGRNVGFELGYMQSESTRDVVISTVPISTRATIQGPTFDIIGLLPLGNSGVSGIGSIGVSDLSGKTRIQSSIASASGSKSEFGYRGGVGFEYRPTYHFGIRVMGRYQSADFDSVAKHSVIGTVGFNFYL